MNSKFVFGIDEVGRGCVAGSLVVCACLDSESLNDNLDLNDSKKLTPKKRENLFKELKNLKVTYFLEVCPASMIDNLGMATALKYTFLNLSKNVRSKFPTAEFIIDGTLDFGIENSKTIVKGDSKVKSIMAASIIAKVYRDFTMSSCSKYFNSFSFESHKGYLTKNHISEIAENGATYIHRKSFLTNYL